MTTLLILVYIGCAKHNYKKIEPPSPIQIFEAYEQVSSSGSFDDEGLQNIHMKGTMQAPMMDTSMVLDSWIILDEGLLTTYEIPNIGTGGQGYNMEHAWILDPMKGDRLLEGAEREGVIQEYQSVFIDSFADLYLEPKVMGWKEVYEQEVWQVEAINKFTNKPSTLFFSIDSKLLIAEHKQIPMGKGSLNAKIHYKEYKSIDGELIPVIMEIKTMGLTQVISFDLIEINVDNPPEITMPESIRAFIGDVEQIEPPSELEMPPSGDELLEEPPVNPDVIETTE